MNATGDTAEVYEVDTNTDPLGVVVAGSYKFENVYTLVFKSSTILKPNTIYTGTVKTSIKSLNNIRVGSDHNFSFTTESLTPPRNFFYGSNFYGLNRNVPTSPINPTYSGYITSCSVSPVLPTGLYLLDNCTIYGNPQVNTPTEVYTITASNEGGSTSARISIAVTEVGDIPLYLGYAMPEYKLAKDIPSSSINPSVVGEIISCSVSPALPAGLVLGNTCIITGTPTEFKVATDYTVTATVPSTTIWEGIGNLPDTISLSQSPASIVAVDYSTENGTAIAGSDFTAVSGTLYFRTGETSKIVNVPITHDSDYEGSENFKFKLLLTLGDNSVLGTTELLITLDDLDISWDLIAFHPFDGDPNDRVTGNTATLFGAGGAQNLPQLTADRKGNANSAYLFDLSNSKKKIALKKTL